MKRLFILIAVFAINVTVFAGQLVLIPMNSVDHTRQLIQNPLVKVHLLKDAYLIASIETNLKEDYVVLDNQAFADESEYYLVYCSKNEQSDYLQTTAANASLLYANDDFVVLKYNDSQNIPLQPFHNDGMVRIMNTRASLPKAIDPGYQRAFDPDPEIISMLNEVSGANLTTIVQHLEDYGTRNCYTPQSVEAQNWIAQQFTDLGLSVEIMDFQMSGSASDNVIATLTGTVYPDEYVICGSHYDSYANGGGAPGADDNASGSAAVIEIARILSQYTFDRTIVFCTFSGEEYGLYGSGAYASRCADEGMNIQGYFNLDMIGYLQSGSPIHTDLIYPSSAQELADFYTDVCATYLPDFIVGPGALSGGDSDHTSFNNNGYMGIFPFEDSDNYSPYIHTPNDLVGLSYNNEEQAVTFTMASLASVVSMANRLMPPQNLVALPGDNQVELSWLPMPVASNFFIYRDGIQIGLTDADATTYLDASAINGTEYTYYITAIYEGTGEESDASNVVSATPMPPLTLPITIDFENGSPYWEINQNWGLTTAASHSPTHSLTESPTGPYDDNELSQAVLRPFNLDLGYTTAELSFWNKFNLESGYDYMYFEITTNGSNWTALETFNGNQNSWQLQSYSLDDYLGESFVQVRFRFTSDVGVTEEGMFIDDFSITVEGGYQVQSLNFPEGWSSISSYINPVSTNLEDVFASLGSTLLAVQTMTDSYLPMDGINTLGNWDAGKGYKIKLANPASMQMMGTASGLNNVNVQTGWNLIPVLSSCDVTAEDFLALNASVEIIKEAAGSNVNLASESITGLSVLSAGRSYFVKVTEPGTLSFPYCTSRESTDNQKLTESFFNPTGNSHIIVIPAGATAFCSSGDEIRAFDHTGVFCGRLLTDQSDQTYALVIFGNDSLSVLEDGFQPNAEIFLKWYDSNQQYHNLTATYNEQYPQTKFYSDQGLSKILSLTPDFVTIEEQTQTFNIQPNPANDQVVVHFNNATKCMLTITTIDGRVVGQMQVENNQIVDISHFSEGIYYFSLETNSGKQTKKILVR
jgi:hypothetical protein